MSIEEKIITVSGKNSKLLQDLSDTEYASSALQQNAAYLKDLVNEIAAREKTIKGLEAKTRKERSEHLDYKDSSVKKLAYKLGGKKDKFNEKAAKEEREYLEALQNEVRAKQELSSLQVQQKEAQQTRSELEGVSAVHTAAEKELDALYDSIFAGPTPAFPEEDNLEEPVRKAKEVYQEVQVRLTSVRQANGQLADADKCMGLAAKNIDEALKASEYDMWGGGSWADAMERSALGQAQTNANYAVMLIGQAQRCDPEVKPLPPMNIAHGHIMSDMVFDNIFTDMSFHNKIQDSSSQVRQAWKSLIAQTKAHNEKLKAIVAEADQAKQALDQKRAELQKFRASLFEKVSSGSGLPEYSA